MDDDLQAAVDQINMRLDYIEDHIVAMSQAGSRLIYIPMGRATYRPTDLGHVPPEVVDLARAGKRKDAIIKYRELTGADVEQAKTAVDGRRLNRLAIPQTSSQSRTMVGWRGRACG